MTRPLEPYDRTLPDLGQREADSDGDTDIERRSQDARYLHRIDTCRSGGGATTRHTVSGGLPPEWPVHHDVTELVILEGLIRTCRGLTRKVELNKKAAVSTEVRVMDV